MTLKQVSDSVIVSWLVVGLCAQWLALGGWLGSVSWWLLLGPGLLTLVWLGRAAIRVRSLSKLDQGLTAGLAVIWLSHLLQVLVPETGFDAVWYHLPVAKAMIEARQFVYLPELYQSVNPLFADTLFALGWQAAGDTGAKLVAYGFGLGLLIVSYQVARLVLPRSWSLLAVIVISTFQVVAWQSASFYVDVAKAMFDLSLVWFGWRLVSSQQLSVWLVAAVGLSLGASIGTKIFSIALLPVLCLGLVFGCKKHGWSWPDTAVWVVSSLVLAVVVAFPYYWLAFQATGSWLPSINQHLGKLDQISGQDHFGWLIVNRVLMVPWSVLKSGLVRDYTWIGLPFGILAVGWWTVRSRQLSKIWYWLGWWALAHWFIWWVVPPLSTRYALAGFVLAVILSFKAGLKLLPPRQYFLLGGVVVLTVSMQFLPRVWVNFRSAQFILGRQTKLEYVSQFQDGWIDRHLEAWHQLEFEEPNKNAG